MESAEAANREDRETDRRTADELRGIKRRLLLSNYGCSDGDSPEAFYYPFQDHFAHLGMEYEYLAADRAAAFGLRGGEGIRIRSVRPGSPAHEAGLRAGDAVLRVDGKPVRPSGLKGRRLVGERWVNRAEIPDYVAAFLPGDRAEFEVAYTEAARKAAVRVGCRVCGEKCPFSVPAMR
jgi:hypothetical protein